MKEKIVATGGVKLVLRKAKSNEIVEIWESQNKIVNEGISNVAKLLGGAAGGKPISKVGFGEGTSDTTSGDTSLINSFIKNIDTVSYPAINKVQFNFTLSANEGNGLKITELALMNTNNVMFSRKTRTAIVKTDAIIISGIWTITIN